jgi:hypothetical protein
MEINIVDNFLEKEEFNIIKNTLIGVDFPWFYNENFAFDNIRLCSDLNNQCFTHMFYKDNVPHSPYFDLLNPILEKINLKSLVRIKANLSIKSESVQKYGYHVDYLDFGCYTSILYLNTNDGKTFFEDGNEVESVENRFVTFSSNIFHSGSTCSNSKYRSLINFNYF